MSDRDTRNEQSERVPPDEPDAGLAIGRKRGEWIRPYSFPPEELQKLAIERAPSYRVAVPFPHTVIDGLVPDDVIAGVLAEFPGLDDAAWTRHHDRHQLKLQGHRRELHGPLTRQIIDQFMSAEFLAFLETLTGIEGLITDPSMLGGGLHQTGPGGYLNIHTDQTYEPRLRLQRRVNMILYLNRDWSSSYGGDLELWDADRRSCVTTIAPVAGRMVVFNTDVPSWHGHPQPLHCPIGTSRRSVALYYFTSPVGTTRSGLRSSDRWPGPGSRLHVTKNYRVRHASTRVDVEVDPLATITKPTMTQSAVQQTPTALDATGQRGHAERPDAGQSWLRPVSRHRQVLAAVG